MSGDAHLTLLTVCLTVPPFGVFCAQLEKLEQMLPMSEEGGAAAAAAEGSEKDEAAMAARAQEQQMVSLI